VVSHLIGQGGLVILMESLMERNNQGQMGEFEA